LESFWATYAIALAYTACVFHAVLILSWVKH